MASTAFAIAKAASKSSGSVKQALQEMKEVEEMRQKIVVVENKDEDEEAEICPTTCFEPDLREGDDDGHGLAAANLTEGHRFLAPGAFTVTDCAQWETALRERHVIVLDSARCVLYEVYKGQPHADGSWDAYSGAHWVDATWPTFTARRTRKTIGSKRTSSSGASSGLADVPGPRGVPRVLSQFWKRHG